jgi:hypothetical protein
VPTSFFTTALWSCPSSKQIEVIDPGETWGEIIWLLIKREFAPCKQDCNMQAGFYFNLRPRTKDLGPRPDPSVRVRGIKRYIIVLSWKWHPSGIFSGSL